VEACGLSEWKVVSYQNGRLRDIRVEDCELSEWKLVGCQSGRL